MMRLQNIYKKTRKQGYFFLLLFFVIFFSMFKEGKTAKILSPPLKAYTFFDQVFLSGGGKVIARLKFKDQKKSQKTVYLIRGVYKKMGTKIDKFKQERFLIIWQDIIIRRENKVPQTIDLKKVYSYFYSRTPLILTGTSFDIRGDLRLLFSKILKVSETEKMEKDQKIPCLSSSEEKKKDSSSEILSILEGNLSKEGFKPEMKKLLRQKFQPSLGMRRRGSSEPSSVLEANLSQGGSKPEMKKRSEQELQSSLGEKKSSFFEESSILGGHLSQGGLKSEVKRHLTQEFQEGVQHPKKYKKQNESQEQGRYSQEFVPEIMEVEILKEGCSPRIDVFQESVIIQTRSIIRKNGKIYKEEPCSDSSERYPLKKRYEGCRDLILKKEGRVHPQYKYYWVDDKGSIHEVDQPCKPDEDIIFEILEDKEACDLSVDFLHMTAHEMATLYYKDYRKRRILLEGCRPILEKEDIPLKKIFCGYHHNFEEGKSIPQTRIAVFIKGQERRITPCRDDGEALLHQISTAGCDLLIDRLSGKKFSQGRVMIETQEGPLFLTQCRPSQELEETGEGCSQKFDHDLEMGQSRGYTRFFYKKEGRLVYVTRCEPSEKIFLHQVRQVGYVHDDAAKISKVREEVYIETPDAGIVLVERAKIRNESPSLAYQPKEIREDPDTENAFYEGCFKITPQNRLQVYHRPDGTVFEEIIGKGSLKKSQNLCKISEETSEHKSSAWMINVRGRPCSDVHYPAGSHDGTWLNCHEAKRRAPWGDQNVSFFLYHYSFLEKRLKTDFPSGESSVGSWERISPTQNVLTQVCQ